MLQRNGVYNGAHSVLELNRKENDNFLMSENEFRKEEQ